MRYISSVTYNCFFFFFFIFFFIFFFVTLMMMITASEALIQKSEGLLAPAVHNYYYNETSDDHDLLSLLALKDQLVGAPGDGSSNILSSWNINHSSHLHFCQWPGVVCGRRHKKRVVALYLPNAGLAGTISPHIANLSFLACIQFANNSLHGQIPAEMGRLRRLKTLGMYNNSLTGEIPANLSYCSRLDFINLARNHLKGNIPFQLGYLPNLRVLDLAPNKLTGSIPASLGNLTNLVVLFLTENSLSGSIPKELGQLSCLEKLYLSLNLLSGRIPPSLFNLSSLTELELLMNNLHGNLPPALGLSTALPNLRRIRVGSNFLTGHIPPSLSNLSSLEDLNLANNSLTGPIPSNLGRLQNLKKFQVYSNKLQAVDEDLHLSFLPQLITNCSLLEWLDVSDNRLTGWLPPDSDVLTNFSSNLRELYLGENPIRGNLPKWTLNLENLEILYLRKMNLPGEMPSGFGKLTNLKHLHLAKNRFSGVIPPSIGNITSLNYLLLNENGFKGHIPSSVGNFRQLIQLNLFHNALTGPIPKQVFSILSLSKFLDLSYNALSGTIPMEVGNLQNLGRLDISNNHLSGEMPNTLSNCLGLEHLSISGNLLNGTIPASLSILRGIVTLGLDRNNLSDEIPNYLGDFAFLSYLNLSFNNLPGKVPENGIFKNASAFSIVGNEKLCGGIKELQLPPCSSTTHPLHKKSRGINLHHLKKILLVTGVIVSLVFFIFLMFLCWGRRTSRRKSGSPSSYKDQDDKLIRSVGYKELVNATNGFSPSNLIGKGSYGSVYRGVLLDRHQNDDNDNDEEEDKRVVINVAVKVFNLQNRGASKSFVAECEALRSIRHRNLVKIITACSSVDYNRNDFKALVFAYLPNGSLETWLHPKQYYLDETTSSGCLIITRNLTVQERLNIAIDVASAVEYLHYHCETPIVHRDLKPSNILLDNDMNAYVGDFGIARVLLSDTTTASTTTSIKGTIGYIAPEYGLDEKVSKQGDVYNYGVLLLEMFTGKRHTEEMFSDSLSLHQFVKESLLEHQTCLEKIVDPVLLLQLSSLIGESSSAASNSTTTRKTPLNDNSRNNIESCLLSVLQFGVHCSEELPNKRVEMNHVVSEMHSIRDKYLIGTAIHRNMQM